MTDTTAGAVGLGRKVATGAAWSFAGILSERLVAFAVFAFVVRRLAPADVGVVTLATVFIDLTLILTQGGLPEAIIRHQGPTPVTYDTAFWTNMAFGAVLTLILCALARPIAVFYASPVLEPVLYVLSGAFPLTAAGAVQAARLTRDFRFRALAARSVTATVAGGAVALALSVMGYGLWALVVQRLVVVTLSTVSLWIAARWMPRLRFSREEFRHLVRFGMTLTASTLLLQLTSTVTLLIIGRAMSSAAVGYYRVASRLFDVVSQLTIAPIGQVALAAFASVAGDRRQFADLYIRMTGIVALLCIATFLGLAALAGPAIRVLFGPDWAPSAPLLGIMCLVALPLCVNTFVWPVLTAQGRGGAVLRFGMLQLSASVVLSLIAAPFGAAAVAMAYVARGVLVLPYALRLTAQYVGASPGALLRRLTLPVLCTGVMVAGLYLLQTLEGTEANAMTILLTGIPLGIAVYGVALLILAPGMVRDLAALVHSVRT